ncbi:MAG: hypothetical protein ACOX8Q_06310 [Christensenellales bacterium]|jgi:hypothetical protein
MPFRDNAYAGRAKVIGTRAKIKIQLGLLKSGPFYAQKRKGMMSMFETAQPQADDSANQPDMAAPESGGTEGVPQEAFLTVRYNKEERPLSKEAAVEFAQKGMNYDKLYERLKQAADKLTAYEKSDFFKTAQSYADKNGRPTKEVLELMQRQIDLQLDPNAARQTAVDSQLDTFMRANPGIDPRALPEDVLKAWKRGVPLYEAYLAHQAGTYKAQLDALEKAADTNRRNAVASMGKAGGGAVRSKPLSEESIRAMTREELEKNHERIWVFLTEKRN